MLIEDVINYKFNDSNFIKDYRKTAAILDAKTRETLELLKKD